MSGIVGSLQATTGATANMRGWTHAQMAALLEKKIAARKKEIAARKQEIAARNAHNNSRP